MPPYFFDIACDKCNGRNIHWSEYEHLIWCYDCQIDTKGTPSIFDGPIPIHASYLLGLTFDKFNLETNQIERLNLDKLDETGKLVWDPPEIWEKLKPTRKEITIKRLKDGKFPNTYGNYLHEEGSKYFKLVPSKHNSTKCPKKLKQQKNPK